MYNDRAMILDEDVTIIIIVGTYRNVQQYKEKRFGTRSARQTQIIT